MTVLSSATFHDRLRVLNRIVGRGGATVRRVLAAPYRTLRRWREKAPDRLLIAPQDIRTGDPTVATEIDSGYFAFGGKIVNARGLSPFALEQASAIWARQLNGFGWLRHLRTSEDPRIKRKARDLVDAFLQVSARPSSSVAWETDVAARRMLSWMSQSPIILADSDHAFYSRFMAALVTTRFHLERRLADGARGRAGLLAAIALAEFGLCGQDLGAFQRDSSDQLAGVIKTQILPDGGHISRDPQALIDLLLDLLPLRQAYAARGVAVPSTILNAIDRMMPMLRLFRHGDGALALFNGMSLTAPELVATILAYDDARAKPLANAPYSGYQRLEAEASVVVVDAGAPPPRDFSHHAHAGCLAFEFSHASQRIVLNCGAPEISRANARDAARTTAAHSTLVLDDTSSCRFAAHVGLGRWLADEILSGPGAVTVEREGPDEATGLRLSHDGYVARFGYRHARDLALSRDGLRLEGRDALEPSAGVSVKNTPYVLRFHLHPGIAARVIGDGRAVVLDYGRGERWVFQADALVAIEPSILFAASGGPRATLQLRVSALSEEQRTIHWAFQRRSESAAA